MGPINVLTGDVGTTLNSSTNQGHKVVPKLILKQILRLLCRSRVDDQDRIIQSNIYSVDLDKYRCLCVVLNFHEIHFAGQL